MSTNVAKFFAVATVVGAMLSASDTRADKQLNTGIVIRGMPPNSTCSGANVVPVDDRVNDRVSGLSVNCTDQTTAKSNYTDYTRGLPNNNFCVGRITQIVRKNGKVLTNPTSTNRLHCLVSGITVNHLASEMTYY